MKVVCRRRTFRLGVVGAVALTLTASAYAYVCHPDLPGTRTLSVKGRVDRYSFSGWHVTVRAWERGCERSIVWRPARGTSAASGCTKPAPATGLPRAASDGRLRDARRRRASGDAGGMDRRCVDRSAPVAEIAWRERGGPAVRQPERRGFGSRLIEQTLAREFGAEVRLDFAPAGVECHIRLPLAAAAPKTSAA